MVAQVRRQRPRPPSSSLLRDGTTAFVWNLPGWGRSGSTEKFRRVSSPSCRSSPERADSGEEGSSRRTDLFSIAPMMDVTDRHFNRFARSISRRTTLWTEMVVDQLVIHAPEKVSDRLRIREDQRGLNPIVLQLGGAVPHNLARAVDTVKSFGYDEINLNCGCPSDKVSGKGCFGAALMKSPELVAESTARMQEAVSGEIPISVKCRIGVDDEDSYENLASFVQTVSRRGGVTKFAIHARKAILRGLSPEQNRTVPPLKYDYVYQLLRDFPQLRFILNGGVQSLEDAEEHLARGVHGVMLGRAVRDRTWDILADVDRRLFKDGRNQGQSRRELITDYAVYADELRRQSPRPSAAVLCRPFMNAFYGEVNARRFRAVMSERMGTDMLSQAVASAFQCLDDEVLDRRAGEPKPELDLFKNLYHQPRMPPHLAPTSASVQSRNRC